MTAICAPSILITKPKFHFLVHLPAYIRRFGPAIIFSTERYESFNHVFRLTCIHSSHQGPSHDTCRTFAWFDILKHIITGGFWYERDSQKWIRAGPFVLNFLSEHPAQARLLGIDFDEFKDKPIDVAGNQCHVIPGILLTLVFRNRSHHLGGFRCKESKFAGELTAFGSHPMGEHRLRQNWYRPTNASAPFRLQVFSRQHADSETWGQSQAHGPRHFHSCFIDLRILHRACA